MIWTGNVKRVSRHCRKRVFRLRWRNWSRGALDDELLAVITEVIAAYPRTKINWDDEWPDEN